jgi:cysteine protease ATG4
MTYRAIFPEMDARSKNYVTDTGWGCMVRVGQMLMAQTLKKHLKIKTK